jgi:hypothetical protein
VRVVLLRIIVVSGLSAIAMATSGCLGDSDAEAESPPATTTAQVETRPPAQSAVDIAKFRAAFKKAFRERPWYGQITGMKMAGRTLEIATKLDPGSSTDEDSDGPAICHAGANLALDFGELGDGIEWVTVLGSDGVGLGSCA